MKILLYFLIIATIIATGKCISCYNCYEESELKRNFTEFDIIKMPTRACVQHFGKAFGDVCTAPTTCGTLEEVSNDGHIILLFQYCSSSFDVDEAFRIKKEEYKKKNSTIRIQRCNTDFCNRPFSISSAIRATSLATVLPLILFLIYIFAF